MKLISNRKKRLYLFVWRNKIVKCWIICEKFKMEIKFSNILSLLLRVFTQVIWPRCKKMALRIKYYSGYFYFLRVCYRSNIEEVDDVEVFLRRRFRAAWLWTLDSRFRLVLLRASGVSAIIASTRQYNYIYQTCA